MRAFHRRFVLTAGLLLLALPGTGQGQASGDHQYTQAAIVAGAQLYAARCALCHGPNGDFVDGIDLRRGRFRRPLSDQGLREVVTSGAAAGAMPAFALSSEELDGLVAFIRAGFDPDGVAVRVGDAARGRELFEGSAGCAACHRVNGRGPRVAPDLTDIGGRRTPAALQRSLLDPTGSMLPINRPVRLVTRDGRTIEGRRLNEDTYTVQVIDTGERLLSLRKADLVEFEVALTSPMPPMTRPADEVADVLAYLLSLGARR